MSARAIVVMAGGSGERFWPMSRKTRPKQLLALTSDKPMLTETVERAQGLAKTDAIYVVAGPHLMPGIRALLPYLPARNFITEPMAKSTAPCLALAACVIERQMGDDTTIGVLSADSLIRDKETFLHNADLALEYAEKNDALVTLGIRPRHPDTGFGYLETGAQSAKDSRGSVHRVESFREKPDGDTARHYMESGQFLWNSGMFFWRISTFQKALTAAAPQLAAGSRRICDAYGTANYDAVVTEVFEQWPSVSIDYALMERAENVFSVVGSFDWDDVGTWSALTRTNPLDESGNARIGHVLPIDTRNSVLFCQSAAKYQGKDPILVTLGVEDLVVVVTDDAVLVCRNDRVQDIKQALKIMRERGEQGYL